MWVLPVVGIGQDNSACPAIWAMVSSPLFAIIKDNVFWLWLVVKWPLFQKSIGGFGFVDDADLCVSDQPTAMLTAHQMQASVAHWAGLLQIMGGALVPDKCFWYLIEPWSKGKRQYNLHVRLLYNYG